jgi:GMP synthase-like glutamine amidotransferase
MHVHIFQHVPFEGPGSIQTWLEKTQARVSTTRFYAEEFPPDIDDIDFLIMMGGPMSVNDTDSYPWLELEEAFINATIHAGKPVLGICLGAQLIAYALGEKIYLNPVKEIGWFPIFGKEIEGTFRLSEKLSVFHWHGETFDLPPQAQLLASTTECKNQAFQLAGKKVIGIQFHLETTPESLDAIITNCRGELSDAPRIMTESDMRSAAPALLSPCNAEMDRLLDYLTG